MRRISIILGAALVAAPVAAAAQDAPAPRGNAAPLAFWESVGDTTLVRLVRQALSANGDVRAAAARVDQARAVRTDAALNLAPTVTAVGTYSRQRLPLAAIPGTTDRGPDYDYWDAGVEANWELDLFGRLRGGLRGRNALVGERLTVSLGRSRPYWVERQTGFYLFEEDVKDPQKLPAQWARLRSQ